MPCRLQKTPISSDWSSWVRCRFITAYSLAVLTQASSLTFCVFLVTYSPIAFPHPRNMLVKDRHSYQISLIGSLKLLLVFYVCGAWKIYAKCREGDGFWKPFVALASRIFSCSSSGRELGSYPHHVLKQSLAFTFIGCWSHLQKAVQSSYIS